MRLGHLVHRRAARPPPRGGRARRTTGRGAATASSSSASRMSGRASAHSKKTRQAASASAEGLDSEGSRSDSSSRNCSSCIVCIASDAVYTAFGRPRKDRRMTTQTLTQPSAVPPPPCRGEVLLGPGRPLHLPRDRRGVGRGVLLDATRSCRRRAARRRTSTVNEDETFYVLDGTPTFRLGDETDRGGPRRLRERPEGRPPLLPQLLRRADADDPDLHARRASSGSSRRRSSARTT